MNLVQTSSEWVQVDSDGIKAHITHLTQSQPKNKEKNNPKMSPLHRKVVEHSEAPFLQSTIRQMIA
jgi:hypothetical protein